jgi:hypothetical protein
MLSNLKAAHEQSGKNPLVFCISFCEVISGSRKLG